MSDKSVKSARSGKSVRSGKSSSTALTRRSTREPAMDNPIEFFAPSVRSYRSNVSELISKQRSQSKMSLASSDSDKQRMDPEANRENLAEYLRQLRSESKAPAGLGASGKEEADAETSEVVEKDTVRDAEEDEEYEEEGESMLAQMPLKSRVLTLLALALSIFIAALDQTIVASSMPAIAEHFGALSSVNWIATSFLLASTALQPLYGRLSDIFGRIETLVVGLVIFLIGSAVSGAAATLPMLIAGRAVQGLGASALMSLVMVIVADITIERERGKLSSVFGSVWAISSVLGPVLGGVFTDSKAGWRWVFYFSLPVGAVAGICVALFLRLPRPQGSFMEKLKRVDFIGIAVLVVGVVMFLLALSFGGKEYPWSSPTVICLLVFGILVILAFAVLEWKVPSEPIMPMRLFQNRNVGLMLVLNIFLGAVVFGPTFYIPIYFSVVKNASAIGSGLRLLPFMLPITFCSIFCGIFTSKTGRYRELIWVGGAITTLGIGLLALLNEHSSAGASIGILLVSGIGVGFCLQPTMIALQTAAEPRDMATATTLFVSVRTLGGTISLAIFQAVLQNAIKPKLLALSQQFPEYAAHIASTVDRQSNIYSPGIPEDLRNDIVVAYVDALRLVFYAMIPFAAMILVCTLPARHVPLKTQMTKTISE